MDQPLKSAWFHIMVAIAAGRRHGYAIRQEVEQRTEGRVRLWPATLYGALSELAGRGLLEESTGPECIGEDARRRCYALTAAGRAALEEETRRLEELVRSARAGLSGATG